MFLIYARVSSIEQAAEGTTSLAEQMRRNRAWATTKGATQYDVVEFTDKAVSGSLPLSVRPNGGRMLAEANRGDTLVAYKLDRMFRSALDALTVAKELKERGIDLAFLDFMGGEPVTGNGLAQCFFTMTAAFAQFERDKINERTADGRRMKKQNGGHVGGSPPYGFKVEGKKREAKLVPNIEEQDVIRLAARIWRRNESPCAAVRELNSYGIRDRAGNPFRFNQVQRLVEAAKRI